MCPAMEANPPQPHSWKIEPVIAVQSAHGCWVGVIAACAGVAGCVWWGKRRKRSQGAAVLAGQPVGKTSSGLPFNQDLDSARGPGNQDPETPPQSVGPPSPVGPEAAYREPDHAPAGDVMPQLPLSPKTVTAYVTSRHPCHQWHLSMPLVHLVYGSDVISALQTDPGCVVCAGQLQQL